MPDRLFDAGVILATAGALRAMEFNEVTPQRLLERHMSGDWGHLSASGKQANEHELLAREGLVKSRYRLDDGELVLVTTDFDEGRTLISQPGDDEEMERCAADWQGTLRGALHDAMPPAIARFLVRIWAEAAAD